MSLRACRWSTSKGNWSIAEALLNQHVMVDPVDRDGIPFALAFSCFAHTNTNCCAVSNLRAGHTPLAHAMKVRKQHLDAMKLSDGNRRESTLNTFPFDPFFRDLLLMLFHCTVVAKSAKAAANDVAREVCCWSLQFRSQHLQFDALRWRIMCCAYSSKRNCDPPVIVAAPNVV